jgi:hypothetical protein
VSVEPGTFVLVSVGEEVDVPVKELVGVAVTVKVSVSVAPGTFVLLLVAEAVTVAVAVEVAVLPATVLVGVAVLVRVFVLAGVEVRVEVFVATPTAVLVAVALGAVGATVKLRVHPEMIANIRRVSPARPCQMCERFIFPSDLGSNRAQRTAQSSVGMNPKTKGCGLWFDGPQSKICRGEFYHRACFNMEGKKRFEGWESKPVVGKRGHSLYKTDQTTGFMVLLYP